MTERTTEGARHGRDGVLPRRNRRAGNVGPDAHTTSGEAGACGAHLVFHATGTTTCASGAASDTGGAQAGAACSGEAGRQESRTEEGGESDPPTGEEGRAEAPTRQAGGKGGTATGEEGRPRPKAPLGRAEYS